MHREDRVHQDDSSAVTGGEGRRLDAAATTPAAI
jgi:hypothetical protein